MNDVFCMKLAAKQRKNADKVPIQKQPCPGEIKSKETRYVGVQ